MTNPRKAVRNELHGSNDNSNHMCHNRIHLLGWEKEMNSSYVYTVNNKQGKIIDFWIMNQPTPKQATHIISMKYLRVIKPKGERLMKTLEKELGAAIRNEYQHN